MIEDRPSTLHAGLHSAGLAVLSMLVDCDCELTTTELHYMSTTGVKLKAIFNTVKRLHRRGYVEPTEVGLTLVTPDRPSRQWRITESGRDYLKFRSTY